MAIVVAVLGMAGCLSGQDGSAPGARGWEDLERKLNRVESLLEGRRVDMLQVVHGADGVPAQVECTSIFLRWPCERWIRRRLDAVPSDILRKEDLDRDRFPQRLWDMIAAEISPHFDMFDGGRHLTIGRDAPPGLWSGWRYRGLETFMRRGGMRCGFVYGEEWLSQRVRQWSFVAGETRGNRKVWLFVSRERQGGQIHRVYWEEQRGIAGVMASYSLVGVAPPRNAWVDPVTGPEEGEGLDRVALVHAWEMTEGIGLPRQGTYKEARDHGRVTEVWFKYGAEGNIGAPADRLFSTRLPPLEIEGEAVVIVDGLTEETVKFGRVDELLAAARRNLDGRGSGGGQLGRMIRVAALWIGACGAFAILWWRMRRRRSRSD